MRQETQNRIDSLVNVKWTEEMADKAYQVAQDVLSEEQFEVEDVLEYLNNIIRDKVETELRIAQLKHEYGVAV